jgi:hypothetical protein
LIARRRFEVYLNTWRRDFVNDRGMSRDIAETLRVGLS